MTLLYRIFIGIYTLSVRIAAIFGNEKAVLFISGRKDWKQQFREVLEPDEKRIWIHAASLGEFEQGRPVIEKIKADYPDYMIVVTFFSPSGYEIRKDYPGAEYIFYLPMDTALNAKTFISMVKPVAAIFIKYEFWYNYLSLLHRKKIPVYLCSAIFRPNQAFFKFYGGWYRKILKYYDFLFVQTQKSVELLHSIGITNVMVTGDTRFDRVYSIATNAREILEIEKFVNGKPCLIAGSSWEPDEAIFCRYLLENTKGIKAIIAPHEIHESHIRSIEKLLPGKTVRYSIWKENQQGDFSFMIIDNIGMLSSLYRYGQVAYIGGGFGKGIHNILEAATYGLPIVFGPNYLKFQEAVDLVAKGGAFNISNFEETNKILESLFSDQAYREKAGEISKTYVSQNIGATDKIVSMVMKTL